jgi:hypothetical protein
MIFFISQLRACIPTVLDLATLGCLFAYSLGNLVFNVTIGFSFHSNSKSLSSTVIPVTCSKSSIGEEKCGSATFVATLLLIVPAC